MKKDVFYLTAGLLLFTICVQAQITGKIPVRADSTFVLEGNGISPIKVKADQSGHFKIEIKSLIRGIYDLSGVGSLYLEPDFKFSVGTINNKYYFQGKGATENEILLKMNNSLHKFLGNPGYDVWHQYLLTEPKSFIRMLDDYVEKANASAGKSTNSFFRSFIQQEAAFDKRYCLMAYSRFYGLDSTKMQELTRILAIPVAERKENYKKELAAAYQAQFSKRLTPGEKDSLNEIIYSGWDPNNEVLYKNSKYYKDMIGYKVDYLAYSQANQALRDSLKNDEKVKLLVTGQLINNPFIREAFNYRYTNAAIKKAKTTSDIKDIYENFLSASNSDKHKDKIKETFNNLSETTVNTAAPDFSYLNPSGQLVSLKSLRGNYVYIDVWATWCAPCIAEIPSLKKIEENYKNKNIKFVSISVDVASNKQSWLDFVKQNDLKGIQVVADKDFNSDFIKKFGIMSIPRFILIGPDGVIIDNNAKRPSDAKLVAQLDSFKL